MSLKMYQEESIKPLSQIKHVIAIAAGKGGVGKSTITTNLALALQQMGHSVGVMDTDIYGPSIRKMLPEDHLPKQQGQIIIPAVSKGIQMISMAYFMKNGEASVVRAPIANGIITQFTQNVAWGALDYLLIDFPPGTGDIQLTLSQQANLRGAIMVTTPQEVAVMDVRKAMHMFEQVKVPIIGVIENMSFYKHPQMSENIYLFGKGGGQRLALESGVPFLGSVPIDPFICQCGDNGHSIFADSTSTATIFLELANQLVMQSDLISHEARNCLQHFDIQWREMG